VIGPSLHVDSVTMRFGGVVALDAVSFTVVHGTIHALIGPNGAGKSTCFNTISGLYRPDDGSIRFGELDLTARPAHRMAAVGIGRAFQNVALSPHVSVFDTVMLGRHVLTRGGFVTAGLRLPWHGREQRRHGERVREICDFFGLARTIDRPVGELSYGEAKRIDIARALATEPRLLMLDEPAAGLNPEETAEMAQTIHDIRDSLDLSVLLVEHDMSLVMDISDHVTALDFGSVISDGTPESVRLDPAVIRAYLGGAADSTIGEGNLT
jgi:branched-chain amino acid transport system ATP-binding protein